MWETIRNLIVTICSVLIGYFSPLGDIVFVIFFVFLLNCIFGLVAGVGVEGERFNLKKFFPFLRKNQVFSKDLLMV